MTMTTIGDLESMVMFESSHLKRYIQMKFENSFICCRFKRLCL